MSNNNKNKDPEKFHNFRQANRFASVESHGNDKNYNSMMDEFRRAYRVRTNKVYKVTVDELWTIMHDLISRRYAIAEDGWFEGNLFESKFGKRKYIFEMKKLSPRSVQLVRGLANKQHQFFWTTFRVERTLFSHHKSRLIITESVRQNTTIQGLDGQLEKSFFKVNVKKNFKAWRNEIRKEIEKLNANK